MTMKKYIWKSNLTLEELEEIKKNIDTQIKQKEDDKCEQIRTIVTNKFYNLIGRNTQYLKIITSKDMWYANIREIDCSVYPRHDDVFLNIKGTSYVRTKSTGTLFKQKETFLNFNLNGELKQDIKIIPITQEEYENVKQAYNLVINLFN